MRADQARSSSEWDGIVFFDGAHQLGLIAGGQFQDPLREGADIIPAAPADVQRAQSGVAVLERPEAHQPLLDAVFPALAATHQVNRVAALAAAAAELLAFRPAVHGRTIVANAQTLAHALHTRGVPVLGAHKGFTRARTR